MLASVMNGEKLIAFALLRPGYEEEYYGNPAIYEMGCLGRILSEEKQENGESRIIVEGLARVGLGELVKELPFRVAKVKILPEKDRHVEFEDLHHTLIQKLTYLAKISEERINLNYLFDPGTKFVTLVNMIAKHLPLKPRDHYNLLREDSIQTRAERVIWHLDDHIETMELLKQAGPLLPNPQFFN
ncbi:MAG: hypothetical protein AUJ47_09765 [Candidatus Marinimicrobia bacterium CG1_02_48_14]|nr:MAG: hypothetical protein AUJ47_09765 [Candidatus Marinimicrobia bacterium CG1_02_48_14]